MAFCTSTQVYLSQSGYRNILHKLFPTNVIFMNKSHMDTVQCYQYLTLINLNKKKTPTNFPFIPHRNNFKTFPGLP